MSLGREGVPNCKVGAQAGQRYAHQDAGDQRDEQRELCSLHLSLEAVWGTLMVCRIDTLLSLRLLMA